jgi:uncharacterized membrane protein YjjB (DUF3815 family)
MREARASRPAAPRDRSVWWYAVATALLGGGLAALGIEYLGLLALPVAIIATLTSAGLGARIMGRHATSEAIAFTFGAIMLLWPFLLTALLMVVMANSPGD